MCGYPFHKILEYSNLGDRIQHSADVTFTGSLKVTSVADLEVSYGDVGEKVIQWHLNSKNFHQINFCCDHLCFFKVLHHSMALRYATGLSQNSLTLCLRFLPWCRLKQWKKKIRHLPDGVASWTKTAHCLIPVIVVNIQCIQRSHHNTESTREICKNKSTMWLALAIIT